MSTIVEALQVARADADFARSGAKPAAAREFSLAITAIEDAIMRSNRGFAIEGDRYREGDVQMDLRREGADV